jgi:2-keto-3-deoxy-L-arabinonate dehydratase
VHGTVPVIPTPFHENEDLDLDALRRLVDFAAHAGVSAFCLPAYGSEFYKLTEAERSSLVKTAVDASKGRVKVVAQSNHASSRIAADIARHNADLGADVISFAIPRQFALGEDAILAYCATVCRAVKVPVLIQDFNPGGASVGAAFAARLMDIAPNFRYLKLEEPLMGAKVRAIREATKDRIGVLEGWGGMYTLELLPEGICGIMPGLAMCDLFGKIFEFAGAGNQPKALEIFEAILPQIVYSLQTFELYHHCEKRLLKARGLLVNTTVREPVLRLDAAVDAHIEAINARILQELVKHGLQSS